jgi:hypothetical protein
MARGLVYGAMFWAGLFHPVFFIMFAFTLTLDIICNSDWKGRG